MAKRKTNLVIDPEFKAMIPPLTDAERASLEASIKADGVTSPLVAGVIGGKLPMVLLDGHNRYEIAKRLGLDVPWATALEFPDRAAAKAWMFEHQIARRNLSVDQVVMLAAMRGLATDRGTATMRARAADLVAEASAQIANVTAGKVSIAFAWNGTAAGRAHAARLKAEREARRPLPTGAPYVVPEGHELERRSTNTKDGVEIGAWDKTRIASTDPGFDPELHGHLVKRTATARDAGGNVRLQWVATAADEKAREDAMRAAWARHVDLYRGFAGVSVAPASTDAETITLYPLGDPHIGMLAWAPESGDHFDVKIACRELLATVRQLVSAAPPSKRAIVCNLGDFMHAQDDANRTPGHGNPLDGDGRYAKVLDAGHTLLRGIVDAALERHAHVTIRNLPGNHDPRVAAELAMWLGAVYERDPRVTVAEAYAAHQYDRFGCNLFGWHHGDRTPGSELPAIMATDRAEDWGQTTERVWHVGHVHHMTRKESPGCVVETHRTMAGRDAWHAGRYRAGRSLSAITYHEAFGETSRATVNLARVRAALAGKAA
jgi:hypothetical protein